MALPHLDPLPPQEARRGHGVPSLLRMEGGVVILGLPLPERPRNRDEALDRGFDPESATWDRVPPEPLDAKWQEWLEQSVRAAKHRNEPTFEDERCGTRCDTCDERTCNLYGPELRACGVTCQECSCSCTACQRVKEDLAAEVVRMIERDRT